MSTEPGTPGGARPGERGTRPPGQDTAPARPPLEELVRRLTGAGLSTAPDTVADALWLARFVTPSPAGPGDAGTEAPAPENAHAASVDAPPPLPDLSAGPEDEYLVRVRAQAGHATAPVGVQLPGGTALPDTQPLRRALRPLRHYSPPTWASSDPALDEAATAELAAETGFLLPVLENRGRPVARLQLLMDGSTSMAPWHQLLRELRLACGRSGAFHDIAVHYLHELPRTGTVVVSDSPRPDSVSNPATGLRDPAGRTITLVLSDCTGPLWRSGRMQRDLHRWTQAAPVAVLQPLPQRMWSRTHLPPVPGTLRRQERSARWDFRAHGQEPPDPKSNALAVPVLSPTPSALGAWSRVLGGTTPVVRGAAAWVLPRHLASRAPRAATAVSDPARLLRAFIKAASPDAVQLAHYLATAPLILPVMRLVQRVMLPHTGPSELAEVLLSGLLVRRPEASANIDDIFFDFQDGVRDQLLLRVDRGEAALVLREVSHYVERQFGRGTRNVPALAATYLDGTTGHMNDATEAGEGYAHPAEQAFAHVASQVLRRFYPTASDSPRPAPAESAGPVRLLHAEWFAHFRRADRHLHRYDEDGAVRDLEEAIRLLRVLRESPCDNPRSTWLCGLLSGALLRRWRALGMPEDLTDAVATADEGARLRDLKRPVVPGDFVTTGALGDALVALAGEHDRTEDWARLVPPELLEGLPGHLSPSWAVYGLLTRALDAYGVVAGHPDQEAHSGHAERRAATMVLAADALARIPSGEAGDDNTLAVDYEGCLASALALLENGPSKDAALLATTAMKLARYYNGQGPLARAERPDLAEGHARKAASALAELLEDQTERLGPDHHDTLVTLRRLSFWQRWTRDSDRPRGAQGPPPTRTRDDEPLPPGQRSVAGWPARHYGPVPKFKPERWEFRIFGATASGDKYTWSFEEFTELPLTTVVADLHCVSGQTVPDNEWSGVATSTLLALAPPAPDVTHVMVWAEYGFGANLRLHEFASNQSLLARFRNREALTLEHGFPVRLVVPPLYGWKGPKWVRGIEYMTRDRRGFWEERGYHNIGEVRREQRYSYQEEPGEGPPL